MHENIVSEDEWETRGDSYPRSTWTIARKTRYSSYVDSILTDIALDR